MYANSCPLWTSSRHFLVKDRLGRDTNHTASRAGTSVASLLALSVATLTKVIGSAVHNNSAAKNALWADELDVLVGDRPLSVALAVGLVVAQVTNVALGVRRRTVLFSMRVDWEKKLVRHAASIS